MSFKQEIKDSQGRVIMTKIVEDEQHNNEVTVAEQAAVTSHETKAEKTAVPQQSRRRPGITETCFRDAHQSIMATRLTTEDMLPICEAVDEAGYHSLECWGGATFDTCMRYLDNDPWERIREIKKRLKKTKTQMLLRGQNLVGYRHYADDTVKEFVKRAVGNGVDIVRVFDALNDLRNMEVAAKTVKEAGGELQMTISYTVSPVHTLERFAQQAEDMVGMGADSICIKDMAGLLTPVAASALVKAIRRRVSVPIQLHSHYTTGLASMSYLAGLSAGADVIDCSISPFSMGTSQPATEAMVAALRGGALDTGIKLENLVPIAEHFRGLAEKYKDKIMGVKGVNVNILMYQIPGGMYSNLQSQLKDAGCLDKLQEVLKEVPKVRKEMGYPPLVTPTSQIVGTQATMNVIAGERWKMIPKEVKQYFLGYYGRTPAPVDPEIQKLVIGDEKPIECRPGELLPYELEKAKAEVGYLALQDEDVLSYIMFPQVAKEFLQNKYVKATKTDIGLEDIVEPGVYPV